MRVYTFSADIILILYYSFILFGSSVLVVNIRIIFAFLLYDEFYISKYYFVLLMLLAVVALWLHSIYYYEYYYLYLWYNIRTEDWYIVSTYIIIWIHFLCQELPQTKNTIQTIKNQKKRTLTIQCKEVPREYYNIKYM